MGPRITEHVALLVALDFEHGRTAHALATNRGSVGFAFELVLHRLRLGAGAGLGVLAIDTFTRPGSIRTSVLVHDVTLSFDIARFRNPRALFLGLRGAADIYLDGIHGVGGPDSDWGWRPPVNLGASMLAGVRF